MYVPLSVCLWLSVCLCVYKVLYCLYILTVYLRLCLICYGYLSVLWYCDTYTCSRRPTGIHSPVNHNRSNQALWCMDSSVLLGILWLGGWYNAASLHAHIPVLLYSPARCLSLFLSSIFRDHFRVRYGDIFLQNISYFNQREILIFIIPYNS